MEGGKNRRIALRGFISKNGLQPTQMIVLGFLLLIIIGSLLLSLPAAASDGNATNYVDALFTAVTSVCVTGLTVVSTADHWSFFGQVIILLLVQVGGLGIVTAVMIFLMAFHRRIGLKNRILIQTAYGWNSMQGVSKLLLRIVAGTLIVELTGALCYMLVLVPEYGLAGIWQSVFLSVSAFCNAGMDVIGNTSLAGYVGNVWMNLITMILIILGGLGFLVWWELLALTKERWKSKTPFHILWNKTTLHTKIVLSATVVFILAGAVIVFTFEYGNPDTLGVLNFPQKLLAALFQSVTTRTAGFYTISQAALEDSTSAFCMLLMFIGGSPGGTAGGVKTVTISMLFFAVMATIKGQDETRVFHRSISDNNVKKGLTIILLSTSIWAVMTMLLLHLERVDLMTMCYETASAIGTVGLSKDLTPLLHTSGKLIICLMMYLGRIGPITMATAFLSRNQKEDMVGYPEENIMLG
ncbi:MAG: hypothetical protein LUF92_17890 [Clostridiales bacterium]|nr:hypothetical protein [Clostridiales bacterium]